MNPLNIVMIAAECTPFAKTGGLADVVGVLPRLLQDAGHRVMVVLPRYALIDGLRHDLRPVHSPMGVWMGNTQEWCSVQLSESAGFPVYFIELHKFYDRPGLYHDDSFNDYQDNPRRFAFLTRAGLQLCKDLAFKPDIVHVHDWHTAPGAAYLKIWDWNDPILGGAASVLTIHNIAYQGVYDAAHYPYTGLQLVNFSAEKFEDHGRTNFLKGGIYYADMINTVSPTYARETRTPELGYGLAPFLNNRARDYVGILNGVDYQEWDPATDALIPARFHMHELTGKEICKAELQARFGLQVDPSIPIFGVVSRFVEQKGLDLLAGALDRILANMRVQFVTLGSGEKSLESYYGGLPGRFPGRVGSYIGYNNELAHWIEAGADFFVMPSRYEPCGLNQMYSLRYGTLPVVRATGGLEDTVEQYAERSGTGTGFKFIDANPTALYFAIGWAVSTFYDRKQHIGRMVQQAMSQDFSWQKSCAQYERLYIRAIQKKQRSG